MGTMTENLCLKNGCHACCDGKEKGIKFWLYPEEISWMTNGGSKIPVEQDKTTGELIVNDDDRYLCTLYGQCGFLTMEGRCGNYEHRSEACVTARPAGPGCNSCRVDIHGLPPL